MRYSLAIAFVVCSALDVSAQVQCAMELPLHSVALSNIRTEPIHAAEIQTESWTPTDSAIADSAIADSAIADSAIADSAIADSAGISTWKIALIGGVSAGGFIYGHIVQSNLWWKGEKSAFHTDWQYDWRYALGADKLGHFFFPYIASDIYRRAFHWAGMDSVSSLYWASGIALTYETYVEIKDGFSKEWGFSWGDFTADALGAAFPIAQHYIPALRPYSMKISFQPSEKFRAGQHSVIFDDYESTYHWLSIDVAALLPESWKSSYPAWINLCIGHSVKQLDFRGGGTHELYLGIDWNLKGVPLRGSIWETLVSFLQYYHLPAPAIRLYPGVVWYGLKL